MLIGYDMNEIVINTEVDLSPYHSDDTHGKEIVIRLMAKSDGRFKSIDRREEERFKAALQYGIMNNVPMSELADRCCLSLSTFKRRFRQWVGCSPHEWIVARRMEVAYEILTKADITVASLARMCCYSNTSHFIYVFKNYYGITPRMLRQQMVVRGSVIHKK